MKPRSAKNKGARLQKMVAERLLEMYDELRKDDIKSAIMGESGEDIKMSPLAKDVIPFSFECKNVEKLNVWKAWSQAEWNAEDRQPVVVFKKNFEPPKAVVDFEVFLILLRSYHELEKIHNLRDSDSSCRILARESVQLQRSDEDQG